MQKRTLERKLKRIIELESKAADISAQIKTLKEEALSGFDELNLTSIVVPIDDTVKIKAAVVAPVRTVIDESRLKHELDEKTWVKITDRSLNKKKLEVAIDAGEVDVNVVAKCSNDVKVARHIRISQ